MCIAIVERPVDGILRVKPGVAAFTFNPSNDMIIMLLFVAVDHSRVVDGILVVRDRTEVSI